MITVDTPERNARIKFSKLAAKHFEKNPSQCAYSKGSTLEPGALLAIRHSIHNVIVVRLSDDELELYPNVISVEG